MLSYLRLGRSWIAIVVAVIVAATSIVKFFYHYQSLLALLERQEQAERLQCRSTQMEILNPVDGDIVNSAVVHVRGSANQYCACDQVYLFVMHIENGRRVWQVADAVPIGPNGGWNATIYFSALQTVTSEAIEISARVSARTGAYRIHDRLLDRPTRGVPALNGVAVRRQQ